MCYPSNLNFFTSAYIHAAQASVLLGICLYMYIHGIYMYMHVMRAIRSLGLLVFDASQRPSSPSSFCFQCCWAVAVTQNRYSSSSDNNINFFTKNTQSSYPSTPTYFCARCYCYVVCCCYCLVIFVRNAKCDVI